MDEEFEDDAERERKWLKKEFGENDEFFMTLQDKLKKKDNFLNEEEKIKRKKKKNCPDCKGKGVIYSEYPWYMFAFNPRNIRVCHNCKGEGRVLKKQYKKLQEKLFK